MTTARFNLSERFALHAPRVIAQPAAADVPQYVADDYLPHQPAVIAARHNDARARIAALLD